MAAQNVHGEYTIHAAGADKTMHKFLAAKFPLGFTHNGQTAHLPALNEGRWKVGQQPDPAEGSAAKGLPGQWVLEGASGRPRFVGQPEGGLRGAPFGYFLVYRPKGSKDFVAAPVSEQLAFKPETARHALTLEEAEAQMKAQRQHHQRANPRLANAVHIKDEDPLAALKMGDAEADADSDEEWKDIRARAAASRVVKQEPQQARKRPAGADEELVEEEQDDENADKGEDWEHEDVAADDDLDMGEGEEEPEASPVRKGGASESDDEAELKPRDVSRRLKRMLRKTGLEESDGEDGASEDGEEESESIEDEEDLDRMAGGLPPPDKRRERSPSPSGPAAAAKDEAASKKRKTATPPPADARQQQQQRATPGRQEAAAKRQRIGASPGGAAAGAGAAPASGVAAAEVRQVLQARGGRMTLSEISAAFKARLLTAEHRAAFIKLVREVGRLLDEGCTKYVVLKQ